MLNNPDKPLNELFQKAINARIFPGAAMAFIKKEKNIRQTYFGCYGYTNYQKADTVKADTVYDLASLTKPLATTLAILSLIKENKVKLNDPLPSLTERIVPEDKEEIQLWQLLNHSAGFISHLPLYEKLKYIPNGQKALWLTDSILASQLYTAVEKRQCYSDLGFMLLGMIVEKKSGMPLDEYVKRKIFQPLGIEKKIFFIKKRENVAEPLTFAPTEDCPWRKRVLSAEVHDDNASAMGGVAGHAGLFGTILGVGELVGSLLDYVNGWRNHQSFTNADLRNAVCRQTEKGTWGLGFDTRSELGSSSGQYFSKASFGHLGFTGTSFWVDPEQACAIILLSNRVHPSRNNDHIKVFRPLFHDTVLELFR